MEPPKEPLTVVDDRSSEQLSYDHNNPRTPYEREMAGVFHHISRLLEDLETSAIEWGALSTEGKARGYLSALNMALGRRLVAHALGCMLSPDQLEAEIIAACLNLRECAMQYPALLADIITQQAKQETAQ